MEILIRSSVDKSMQPSLFYKAVGEHRPLLVGLHTWSFDRFNQKNNLLPIAEKYGFDLLLPEFRGPNLLTSPRAEEACGSRYAVEDVKDAIKYAISEYGSDGDNVLLLGQSGGGHMALLMAGIYPELFRAVAAFVPICDLERWTRENANYAPHVLACCKNDTEEMKRRSPMSYLDGIARSNTKIFHGKYDSCVPVGQSVDLYLSLTERYPKARVFLDVFDGGHELDLDAAFYWLLSQYSEKKKIAVTG